MAAREAYSGDEVPAHHRSRDIVLNLGNTGNKTAYGPKVLDEPFDECEIDDQDSFTGQTDTYDRTWAQVEARIAATSDAQDEDYFREKDEEAARAAVAALFPTTQ